MRIYLVLLMIIPVIHKDCLLAIKGEGQSPVFIDPHRPVSCHAAFQPVQSPARHVHLLWPARRIQQRELASQLVRVFRLDSRP